METHAEDIQIDGRKVLVVRPVQRGRWPGVVMAHEIFGIDDVLRRHAQRLASAGYIVYPGFPRRWSMAALHPIRTPRPAGKVG